MSDFRDLMDLSPPSCSACGLLQARNTGVGCHFLLQGSFWPRDQTPVSCIGRQLLYHWATWETLKYSSSLVAKSCLTLGDPMDCSPPGSSVHGILQARLLEWVATSFSRGSFQPRNQTQVSCIAGRFFTDWVMREAHSYVQNKV